MEGLTGTWASVLNLENWVWMLNDVQIYQNGIMSGDARFLEPELAKNLRNQATHNDLMVSEEKSTQIQRY